MKKVIWLFILIITVSLSGCTAENKTNDTEMDHAVHINDLDYNKELWPNELIIEDIYSDILNDVTTVELRNGMDGSVYIIEDEITIHKLIDILREAKFSIMKDQSDRNGWTYSFKCFTPDNNWFSTTLTYGFSDNIREDGEIITSPYYEINNFHTIFTQIKAVEQELK